MADRISRERKKELEQLDPFQENLLKAMAYAKTFKKQLILMTSVIFLVILVFSGIMISLKKAENSANQILTQALIRYGGAETPEKGYAMVKDDFNMLFTEYANTEAGRSAKIRFARICYDASQLEQSYQYYKESLALFENDPVTKNMILSSLGHVCMARNEFNEARDYFGRIITADLDLLKDDARFALALVEEAEGKHEQSRKMYEQIVNDHEDSMYLSIAKARIQQKLP